MMRPLSACFVLAYAALYLMVPHLGADTSGWLRLAAVAAVMTVFVSGAALLRRLTCGGDL